MLCGGASPNPADDLLALRERLIGTTWRLELKPMFGESLPEPVTDTVTFSAGQLASAFFGEQGYSPSAFTVQIGEDGVEVWESTQLNLKAGIVLWKGELEGGTVRGIVSRHPLEGVTQDYVFIGEEVVPEPEPPAAAEPELPVVPAAPAEPAPSATPDPVSVIPTPEPPAPAAPEIEQVAPIHIQAIPEPSAAADIFSPPTDDLQPFTSPAAPEPDEAQTQ